MADREQACHGPESPHVPRRHRCSPPAREPGCAPTLPKVLHPLGSAPLIAHAIAAARALEPERTVVVVGHGGAAVEAVARALDEEVAVVTQAEQKGTGHAVLQAAAGARRLRRRRHRPLRRHAADPARRRCGGCSTPAPPAPTSWCSASRPPTRPATAGWSSTATASLQAIVEARDATPDERAITLCNSGILAADLATLRDLLAEVRPDNAKGEYYLTDVVKLARARGLTRAGHRLPRGRDPRRQLPRRPRRGRGGLPGPRPRRGDGQRRHADRPGDRLVRARHRGRPRRRRSGRTWSSAPRSPSRRAR